MDLWIWLQLYCFVVFHHGLKKIIQALQAGGSCSNKMAYTVALFSVHIGHARLELEHTLPVTLWTQIQPPFGGFFVFVKRQFDVSVLYVMNSSYGVPV